MQIIKSVFILLILSAFLLSDEDGYELNCIEYPWYSDNLYLVEDINSFDSCNEIANSQNLSFNGCFEYSEEFCLLPGCYTDSNTGNYLYISEDNLCSDFLCNSWVCPDFPENNLADQFTSAEDCIANVGCAAECVCYETWFINADTGDGCANTQCHTDPDFNCYYNNLNDISSPSDCRIYAEDNEFGYHGTWYNAEHSCVDPGCYFEMEHNHTVWIESNSCFNTDCDGDQEFACRFSELEGISSPSDCLEYAGENEFGYHGIWTDAEHKCVDPGCYFETENSHAVWIESNSCLNTDCDGDQEFTCRYSELESISTSNDCRIYAEDNEFEYHGTRYEAENYCVEPGCFYSNEWGYSIWVESNTCSNFDCEGDSEFECRFSELEGISSPSDCRIYAEDNEFGYHGTWYDAEHSCVDPGCYFETEHDHTVWIASNQLECDEGQYSCLDGTCLTEIQLCDGILDCEDGFTDGYGDDECSNDCFNSCPDNAIDELGDFGCLYDCPGFGEAFFGDGAGTNTELCSDIDSLENLSDCYLDCNEEIFNFVLSVTDDCECCLSNSSCEFTFGIGGDCSCDETQCLSGECISQTQVCDGVIDCQAGFADGTNDECNEICNDLCPQDCEDNFNADACNDFGGCWWEPSTDECMDFLGCSNYNISPLINECLENENCDWNNEFGCHECEYDNGCGICGGDGSWCDEYQPNTLWLVDNGDGTYDVGYWSLSDIAGIIFEIDGASINCNTDSNGNCISDDNLDLFTGDLLDNFSHVVVLPADGILNTILAFDLSGSVIPASEPSVLITLDLSGIPSGISNITVSDASGQNLNFLYNPIGNILDTCEDEMACNFSNEGDCVYPEQYFDCEGNCLVGLDCNGVCGGDAVLDCNGVCGGVAVEDICGVCDGYNSVDLNCYDFDYCASTLRVSGEHIWDESICYYDSGVYSFEWDGNCPTSSIESITTGWFFETDPNWNGVWMAGFEPSAPNSFEVTFLDGTTVSFTDVVNNCPNCENQIMCSNYTCVENESDCAVCGDGLCNYTETYETCPSDCFYYADCEDQTCNDLDWHDIDGPQYDCEAYLTNGWCDLSWGPDYPGTCGLTASQACCGCENQSRDTLSDFSIIREMKSNFYGSGINQSENSNSRNEYGLCLEGPDIGCDGVCFSDLVLDECGFCGDNIPLANGDMNNDGFLNVSDIIMMVAYIIEDEYSAECQIAMADLNSDGYVTVSDVVNAVYIILNDDELIRTVDQINNIPSYVELIKVDGLLSYRSDKDGLVGFDIILRHGDDFSISLNESSFISDYKTTNNETRIVMIMEKGNELFTTSGAYIIDEVNISVVSGEILNVKILETPVEFSLSRAYPNPFNPTISFDLSIATEGYTSVNVYNLMGQVVGNIHNGNLIAKIHSFTWNAGELSSGMYILQAQSGGNVQSQKIMLLK